jgi:non-ribosomal peptide synthetase component E (peptide arylation enzyme)
MQMLTKGGWDVGHLGEGGFVHITGRTWKIIIRGGENVTAPALRTHPARLGM